MIYFHMEVSYPLRDYDLSTTDALIENTVGEESVGGGAGFGFRDLSFEFHTKRKAEAASKKLKALKIDGLKITDIEKRDD